MAVKNITNKQVVSTTQINRANQVSNKDLSTKGGNRQQTVNPGIDFDAGYSITLKDVDTAIISHIKNIIRPKVREANETVDVTVMYGNEERWVSVRKRGVLRDKNGSIILPLIMLKRTSIEKNTELNQGFEHDVQRKFAEVLRQSTWSKTNRYDSFAVQTGIKPVYENLLTTMPNFVNITYEFILWTAFIEQMNPLIETFVEHNNTYFGDSEEYKFLSTIDSISDSSEMSAEGERFIKSTFSLTTKAYLLPEYTNSVVTNKISQIQKSLSPSKVVFGFEGDATDHQVGK